MQMNAHFNKTNPLIQNGIYANGSIVEGRGKSVLNSLLNAENRPLTAQLNKARTAFLTGMLHKTSESDNESIEQNNNGALKQHSLQKHHLVIKVAEGIAKPVELSEVKQNPHNRLKQKLQFIAERYQEKPVNSKEQPIFATVKTLTQQLVEKKDAPARENSPIPGASDKKTSPTSYIKAKSQTDNQRVSNEKNIAKPIPANIDDFVKKLNEITFSNQNILGKGSYGTVYRFGDFVVKTPVNCYGVQVDWIAGAQKSANPERVSKYLNLANDDESFSRVANVNFKGKEIKVLVSKYIEGVQLEPEEIDDAEDTLHERGFHMHDINVDGNVLKTKDDKYYFIDADQLVVFSPVLRERRPSETTVELEEGLTSMLAFKHHQATMKNETDELDVLKYEIEAFENATGRTVQKRA